MEAEELKESEILPNNNPNYFLNYISPLIPFDTTKKPKHVYTIELHRCKYTEELKDLSLKYEKSVHKKDREPQFAQQFLSDIPIYNPENEFEANLPCYPEKIGIDDHRVY